MNETLRLLQVEDNESDAALIVRLLEKGGYQVQTERVEDPEGMRAALAGHDWDLVIADHHMARFDAPGALAVLHEARRDIPFILVSGSIGEELAVALMRSGARDYVNKDNLSRLVPAVQRELREARSRRDRRLAERDLSESQERLAMAVKATQLGTFDCTPQACKLIWSEWTKRHFGLPPEAETSYEVFLSGVHPADRERVHEAVQSALGPGGDGQYAAEYRTVGIEDGIERWIASWGRVLFDKEGQPHRFVGVTLDVSERRRLEDQLRQAQKLESVGRLAGGVAHDFNNLLTVIQGYAQMILDDVGPLHPMRDSVHEIVKAAARATDLTRQLLMFSRRRAAEVRQVFLNAVVADFEKMLGRLIGEDVELVLSLHPGAGFLFADPVEIEQVLMNLAVNAKDAMPEGGRLLIETMPFEVDAHTTPPLALPPGGYTMLAVTDTGAGMAPDVKAHLFEPFFTTKEPGKGTGLGLSTVYGIVTRCGGAILIDSEPGRGTAFKLIFPAVAGERTELAAVPGEAAARGDETVLLAEDESGVRKYVRDILHHHGYTVLEAANGRDALARAREYPGPIHLLLADAVMPEMGGLELSRQFGKARPGVPVLCMSGYSNDAWPGAGVQGNYIQKPFGAVALLTQIRTLLKAKSGAT